jgi:hypothetical protein
MNSNITQAIKEAYATAPTDEIIFDTLEFRHESFKDELNQPFALRFIRDFADRLLTLEDTAPLNASEEVNFIACAFDVVSPPEEDAPAPELTITLDNIGRPLTEHIDNAVISENQIEVTYRPYLSTDSSQPQQIIPVTFIVKAISVGLQKVTVTCTPKRIGERPFPNKEYSINEFTSLGNT